MSDTTLEIVLRTIQELFPDLPDDPNADLVDGGPIDSFAIIDIVEGLEDAFGVAFTPEDMRYENFSTLTHIVDLIEAIKKRT
jgi:acyl carrier protein